MRRVRFHVLSTLLVVLGLAQPAFADTRVCSTVSTSLSIQYYTCLTAAATTIELGTDYQYAIEAYSKSPSDFDFQLTGTNYTIRDDHSHVWKSGSTVSGNVTVVTVAITDATMVGNRSIYVDVGFGPDSPNIAMTIRKFTPFYTVNPTATTVLAGQSINITHTVATYAANGKVAFYVRRPGTPGTLFEWATRFQLNYPAFAVPALTAPFQFTGQYATPGPYYFSVAYVGTESPPNSNNFIDTYNTVPLRSSEVLVKVGPYSTTTTLTQSVVESMQGKPVTLTASVAPAPSPIAAPTGVVQFFDGTTLLGSATLTSGTAVLTNTTNLRAVGSRSLTAVYQGDTWNATSTSPAIAHTTKVDPAILVPILLEVLQ